MPQMGFTPVTCPNDARFGALLSTDGHLLQMWWRTKSHIIFEFRRRGSRAQYVRKFSTKSRMRDTVVRDDVYEEMLFRQAPGIFSANPLPAEIPVPVATRSRSAHTERPGRQTFIPRTAPLFANL